MKFKTAIASSDMENVNMHFGRCRSFVIAEADDEDGSYRLSETRLVTPPCPSCGTHGEPDDAIERIVALLSDCEYVITSRIGRWPDSLLFENGIRSVMFSGPIRDAMPLLIAERKRHKSVRGKYGE
ncbi:MAG: hypothetical protein LBU13_09170 [Synergistaceae bacterium]|jgi:predicted Fe-Mo cluster-binding NifX family protein|nr:hypothetical protein [Synergistaceae bacterium]